VLVCRPCSSAGRARLPAVLVCPAVLALLRLAAGPHIRRPRDGSAGRAPPETALRHRAPWWSSYKRIGASPIVGARHPV